MRVPAHPKRASDAYYVLLSIWDNADSYDQIGFASWGSFDTWAIAYSYTTGQCASIVYHANLIDRSLAENQVYLFTMTLQNGQLTFTVRSRGVAIWSFPVATSATHFRAAYTHACADTTQWVGYTNYEEVFRISGSQDAPAWSFEFIGNLLDTTPATQWQSYYSPPTTPPQINTWSNGANVIVANEYFSIAGCCTYQKTYSAGWGYFSGTVLLRYAPYDCDTRTCVVTLTTTMKPPGWTVTLNPSSGTPSFYFTALISVPSGTAPGVYNVEIKGENTPRGQWTLLWIRIEVRTSIGGGCVALDTPILTLGGYVPVQNLLPGSQVVGYNLYSGSQTTENLLWNNRSTANLTFVINWGDLTVTPRDQPLYIKNDTYTGWLQDPQELEVGTLLFRPLVDMWTVVVDLEFVVGSTDVYDVRTSGNFISNEILSLVK